MFSRRVNRRLTEKLKRFTTCETCGLPHDVETEHICAGPIDSDRLFRANGHTSVRCECGALHSASINSKRTVEWYCDNERRNKAGNLRVPNETPVAATRYKPPPLPPATPGSARYANE
jgi:hypothetical protein